MSRKSELARQASQGREPLKIKEHSDYDFRGLLTNSLNFTYQIATQISTGNNSIRALKNYCRDVTISNREQLDNSPKEIPA